MKTGTAIAAAVIAFVTAAFYLASGAPKSSMRAAWDLAHAVTAVRNKFPDVAHISTPEMKMLLDSREFAHATLDVIDVREPDEYVISHLPGAINIPSSSTDATLLSRLKGERPIIVYCSIGYRSALVARRLQRAGYHSVLNYAGSIFDWANEGYELRSGQSSVQIVHPFDTNWGQLLEPERRAF